MKQPKRVKVFLESLLSRKFLLALLSSIVVFGNAMWNWGMDAQEIWTFLAPILGYIGVEGLRDIKNG